ncbi:Ribosomal protein S18 acetylase RimI [Robiginitalea myxolifaciens]|uniref:Ribosomal protein S18 acetylase RimI n=1 Tax=Robiginitalea myxolifaciens TaxID=400055 RepID=A0A1I6FPS4_9FLAO|nr:GNAT family N-acetyltransferase [Robiginitalea myxolifaciens]SFR31945.1 Ribosomal protein S18 acetylase RimI [Robiginitalea myxolifaciens]
MEISIREAKTEDLPELLEMEQALIREERPFDPTIRPDPVHYYDIPEFIEQDDVCLLVATSGARIISCGYAAVRKPRHYLDHDTYGYLGFMYTHPDFRGRGINGRIMGQLKSWCRDRGLKELRLTVYTGNSPAIRAYEKVAFEAHILEMRHRL